MTETQLTERNLRDTLLEVYHEGARPSIESRVRVCKKWVEYLIREEGRDIAARKGCLAFGLSPIGPTLESSIRTEEERIAASSRRQTERRKQEQKNGRLRRP